MPPMRIADVQTVRAARPQAFMSPIVQDGQRRSNSELRDDECDANTQEDKDMSRKSKTPADQNEKALGFVKRNDNDHNAIKHFIIKKGGISLKDGTATGKNVAKHDRFDMLKLWRIEKLDSLERRGNGKGSARSLYPDFYSEVSEEAWLQKTFSRWLEADEPIAINQPFNNTVGLPDHLAQLHGQHDDKDQDDEESIPIKSEFHHQEVASYLERPPQRAAAISAIKSGRLRLSTTPEYEANEDAYLAQEEANDAIKNKHRVAKGRGVKRNQDFDSDSDSEYMQQPAKKYVAIGPGDYCTTAEQSDHKADHVSPEGNMAKVVKRAWKWNGKGRLVVDPPLQGW